MAMSLDDTEEFGPAAPQPIDEQAYEDGNFQHLWPDQGAQPALRVQKTERKARGVGTLVLSIAVSLFAIGGLVALFLNVMDQPIPEAEDAGEIEQAVVGATESITYRDVTYGLIETTSGYALAELHEDDQFVPLGELAGSPAALVLYDGALVIPENLAEGTWDVAAYTIGSGWSALMDKDGNVQGGEGTIGDVALDGSTLRLTVGEQAVDVALAW